MEDPNEPKGQDGGDPEGGGNSSQPGGGGGKGDDTPKVKVGDAEYTTDELTTIVDKGKKYDDLLPDYTRKSQRLAEIDKAKESKGSGLKGEPEVPYLKPDWEPKNLKELREAIIWAKDTGRTEALKTLEDREARAAQVKAEIDGFFAEVKKTDPDFDDAAFSAFVLKHTKGKEDVGLADLRMLHSVYHELPEAERLGEENARKNREERTEKVNTGEGGGGAKQPDFSDLRAKGGDFRDIAHDAHERIKSK
jgi:hypothetical protein